MSFGHSCIKKEALHPQHGQHGWISQHCGPRESSSIVQISVCLNERLRSQLTKLRPTGRVPKKKKNLFRQGPHCCHFSAHLNTLQQPPLNTAPHVFPPFPFASDENTFDPGSDQQRHWQAVCTGPGKLSSQGLSRSQRKVTFNLKYTKKPKGFFLLKSIWKQWEAPACRVCHFVPPSLTSFVRGN